MDGNAILMLVAAVLIFISSVLAFLTTFGGKFKKTFSVKEKALDAVTDYSDGEFRLKLAKHMKDTESAQKELVEVLKNQNTLLQTQINNLRNEINMLSEKQVNQAKSIIKFNKENARQLAISERETLEYVMLELKKAIEDNAGATTSSGPVLEEVSEAELFEVYDLPADEEFEIPDLPDPEEVPDRLEVIEEELPVESFEMPEELPVESFEMPEELPVENLEIPEELTTDIPEIPDEFDLSALFEDLAEGAMEEAAPAEPAPVVEEKAEEPAPAEDPLAGFGSDPNAMMTPEDIAKLLEAMGQ